MARIEGIRIKNYRVLKDITLGRLWNTQGVAALTPMTAVIGKNGVGKSSLFDAFGFLADCLKLGVDDPFYAQQMSDGTLKVFAYLLMLEDLEPPPSICIEEPENGLYHKLLEVLAAEFRAHATGGGNTPQIFVTTHQPYFVDALSPDETWVLEKQENGFSTIHLANDDHIVKAMVEEGLPLGGLWYRDYLDQR